MVALRTLPALKSLFINLNMEDQVDLIMRTLSELEFLNGLRVEREILEDEAEYEEEDPSVRQSQSPVREMPSQEDMEDNEEENEIYNQNQLDLQQ